MITERIPVFFSANAGYYQHLCVAMVSLLENNPQHHFDIRILTDADDRERQEPILQLKRRYENAKIEFKKIELADTERFFLRNENTPAGLQPHVTLQTYYRCLIPNLAPEFDKALYLDCDLLVEGDLKDLWETDIENHYMAAVEDLGVNRINTCYKKNIGLNDRETYVNAGVLLMNLAAMRRDRIVDRLMSNLDRLGSLLTFHDQDLINYTLKGHIRFLDFRFNWTTECDHGNRRENVPVVISHFTTRRKPWSEHLVCHHSARNRYFHYLKKTPYRHFIHRYRLAHFIRGLVPHYSKQIVKTVLPRTMTERLRRAG